MTDKNLNQDQDPNSTDSKFISDLNAKFAGVNQQAGLVSKSKQDIANQVAAQTDAQERLEKSISSTLTSLAGFSQSLMNDGGKSFESLNKIIDITAKVVGGLATMVPYVGGALDGMVKGGAEVGKMLVTTFARAYSNFEKLSDTGVVATFENLREASDKTGLTFEDTSKVMSENSKQLTFFGGNALLGAKRYESIADASKKMSEQFQNIGISASDFASYQLNYINQQTLYGNSQKLTDKQLVEGTKQYIEQLDTLAKVTGKSRKEIEDELKARMQDARYASSIAMLSSTTKGVIDSLLAIGDQLGPTISKSLVELTASSGIARTEDAQNLRYALMKGGLSSKFFDDLKHGRLTNDQARTMMLQALSNYEKSGERLAANFGGITKDTALYVEGNKASRLLFAKEEKVDENISKERNRLINATSGTNSDAAKTRRSMYNTTKNIDLLATSAGMMAKVMHGIAGSVDYATEKLYDLIGGEIPEYLKLRRLENTSQTKINEAKEKLNKQLEIDAKLSKLDPKSDEARELRRRKMSNSEIETIKAFIKSEEISIKELSIKRRKAEQDDLNSTSGAPSSAPSDSPSGTPSGDSSRTTSGAPTSGTSTSGAPISDSPSGSPVAAPPGGLGSLSQKYESSTEGSRAVGWDSGGGTSYGKYQIASASRVGSMTQFLKLLDKINPEASKRLRDAGPADSGKNSRFAQEWKKLVSENAVQEAETQFAFEQIYTPALRKISNPELRKMIEGDRAIQEMLFSSAIQHGPAGAPTIFNKIYRPGMSKQDFVRGVYTERGTYLSKLTPKERQGVLNRFGREQRDVMAMLNTPPATAAQPTAPKVAAPAAPNLGSPSATLSRGPATGYDVVLSGETAVIPANPGSEASSILRPNSSRVANIDTVKMMNQKMDRMISISNANLRDIRNTVNV
jgi:hypothetical protein